MIGVVDLVTAQQNLRHLLNDWDPIGVAHLAGDEYDCLIGPVLAKLDEGSDRSEMSQVLWFQIEDHMGLDPASSNVDAMADRLVAWSAGAGPLS